MKLGSDQHNTVPTVSRVWNKYGMIRIRSGSNQINIYVLFPDIIWIQICSNTSMVWILNRYKFQLDAPKTGTSDDFLYQNG